MSNFIWDNTALPGTKSDTQPPRSPSTELSASEVNTIVADLADIRTAFQDGSTGPRSWVSLGAVGNGVADDTVAVQAIIDANKGKYIPIPPGTYLVAGLKMADSTYNGTKLISAGGVLKLKADGGGSTPGFAAWVGLVVGTADSVVLDLIWDANRSAMTASEHIYCLGIAGATNLTCPRFIAKEIRGDGVYIGQSDWANSSTNPSNINFGLVAMYNSADDGRNAISVISCSGLTIGHLDSYRIGTGLNNGSGAGAPEPGGIDFEPDHGYQSITDVTIGSANIVTAGTSGFQILGKSITGVDATRDWNVSRVKANNILVRKTLYAAGSNVSRCADVTLNLDTSRSTNYDAKGAQIDFCDRFLAKIRSTHASVGVNVGPVGEVRDSEIEVDVADYSQQGVRTTLTKRCRIGGRVSNSVSVAGSTPIAVQAHNEGGTVTQVDTVYSVNCPYDGVASRGFRNETANPVTFDAACRVRDADFTGWGSFALAFDQAQPVPLRVNIAGLDSTSTPSTGAWTQGEFVTNSAPHMQSGAVVALGWTRLTTGTANVLGTDWSPVYAPFSAAAGALTPTNGGTVTPDPSSAQYIEVTFGASVASATIANPSTGLTGQVLEVAVVNGSGGTITTTWGNGYKFLHPWRDPLDTTRETARFRYDGNSGTWIEQRELIPLPTTTTLGGVKSHASVSHQFLTQVGTDGVVSAAQPAFTDISGSVAASQLPNPTASTLGGVESHASVSHQFLTQIGTDGTVSAAQPAFTDISGSVAASQLPNPSASTLGGVESHASVSHQFLTQIGTDGTVSAAQPASADISDAASAATASVIASRDANANTKFNNAVLNETSTATAAATTTLAASSSYCQIFTGTTTQIVKMPDATTLSVGWAFRLVNRSTGAVTVQDNSAGALLTLAAGSEAFSVCTAIGSAAGSWDIGYPNVQATQMPALTGDITTTAGAVATVIGANKVTTTTINANAVTLAKLATQGNMTLLGNTSGSTAVPSAVQGSGARRITDNFQVYTPTVGATVSPLTSVASVFGVRCNAGVSSCTISAPDANYDGAIAEFRIFNNSGGALAVTWDTSGTGYRFGTAYTNPANGKRNYVSFRYDSNTGVWQQCMAQTADV